MNPASFLILATARILGDRRVRRALRVKAARAGRPFLYRKAMDEQAGVELRRRVAETALRKATECEAESAEQAAL